MVAEAGLSPAHDGVPASVEVLYANERTRVSRIRAASGDLIRKETLGAGAVRRARRELRILGRLHAVEGLPRLATRRGGNELLFQDSGGVPLSSVIGEGWATSPARIAMAVSFTTDLAMIIDAIHRAGVVHRDLSPANVLVAAPDDRPVLIDFDLASTFGEERPGFTHHREIVGTLPYLAPEQTGRTAMQVDERADLYALGATVYELLTGEPPFPRGDPLRMIRDTLAVVPVPPADRDPRIPGQLSAIVMRLLEKDPDRRYQSADGLIHDLLRLGPDVGHLRNPSFPLAERDFPRRLTAPARLVGRDVEVAALKSAFRDAMNGGGRVVLVAGGPGVGKSALVNELRAVVTANEGWFVAGKYDQYRPDAEPGGVVMALRALGRLLLAGSETELTAVRGSISAAMGANLPLVGQLPEFAALLATEPGLDPTAGTDPNTAATRRQQAMLELLRSVASPRRPVVMLLDDLQWAGAASVGFVDTVVTDPTLAGVLLIGAYRDAEVDPGHPLATAITRWQRLGVAPALVRLHNLPRPELTALLAEMLRLPASDAAGLADAIGARSAGNPFDTVEFVNALRRDRALLPSATGWTWDADTIRRFVGQGDVVDLLAARIYRLPRPSRELMENMACLGGQVELDVLRAACGLTPAGIEQALLAPLEDGLLVLENADPSSVRFRHDRVQQAAYSRLSPAVRSDVHLAVARRLRHQPGLGSIVAEQYLQCTQQLADPVRVDAVESQEAAELFVAAAGAVAVLNPQAADRFLTAATDLLHGPATGALATGGPVDTAPLALLVTAERQQHAVLYSLGRLVEADPIFARIQLRAAKPVDLVEPTCLQIASLTNRGMAREAVELGLALLRRLDIGLPVDHVPDQVAPRYRELLGWAAGLTPTDDERRGAGDEPRFQWAARLLNRLVIPWFFWEPSSAIWLVLLGRQLWAEHGPSAPLVATLSAAGGATIRQSGDFAAGYAINKHLLAVGDARGFAPEVDYARHIFCVSSLHWYEPLPDAIVQAQAAREGLIRGGDLQMACFGHLSSLAALLDCAPSLDSVADAADVALAVAVRTGNAPAQASYLAYRQLVRALRGETLAPGGFDDGEFTEAAHLDACAGNQMAAAHFHTYRAVAAVLFDDVPALTTHAARAMELQFFVEGFYITGLAHLLQGIALAEQVRTAPPTQRPALLERLEGCQRWLADRADGSPGNFAHLAILLTAETAWATSDLGRAAVAFDKARQLVGIQSRPWHHILIAERAAKFHLSHGVRQTGADLLAEVRRHSVAWSATGKVRHLEERHTFLRAAPGRQAAELISNPGITVSTADIDMLAILRASQALSSETSPARLRARLGAVLNALTGADTVLIVQRGDDSNDWQVWDTTGEASEPVPLDTAGALLPLSALRYAQRTGEPLLVRDAIQDDRFRRDPYLLGLERCSLLVIPLLGQGVQRAALVLENRQRSGAFAADGLGAVTLISGQLTVSLDNAQLYSSLERKVAERTIALAERTAALEEANRKLEALSNTDALTGLPNRRRFDTTLDAEWRRAARQRTRLGLAMIDADHFKGYNDQYGHPAGDRCLQIIAGAIREVLRDAPDLVCRYGGEEFAVILPGTDHRDCLRIADRIRLAIIDLQEPHAANATGIVTVSIGVGQYEPGSSATAADLIAAADRALYEAKFNGRNRVHPAD